MHNAQRNDSRTYRKPVQRRRPPELTDARCSAMFSTFLDSLSRTLGDPIILMTTTTATLSAAVQKPGETIRIIHLSDPHLFAQRDQRLLNVDTFASLQGIVDHIRRTEPDIDAILATGDISQDGSAQACQAFLDSVDGLAPIVRGLPGNHDASDVFGEVWAQAAQAVTDLGHWRIVMLDSTIPGSNAGRLAPDQLECLDAACASADGRHILVAVHHNPVPSGSRWLDAMMIDNADTLFAQIRNWPAVRALVWGHIHQEYDSVLKLGDRSLRLLAAPATCVQFLPRSQAFALDSLDPGYRRLHLHPDGTLDTDVVRVAGLGIQPDASSKGY